MQILVTPECIIKRCLWTKYKKFVLRDLTDVEIEQIITKNELTIISEKDAYVIGLLKVIETENLVHRFNLDMEEFLKIKSTINEGRVIVNKSSFMKEIIEFKDRFPVEYKPDTIYEKSLAVLKEHITDFYKKIENMESIPVTMKDGKTYTYILSNDVKKVLAKK